MHIYNCEIILCPSPASLVIKNLNISRAENPLEFNF